MIERFSKLKDKPLMLAFFGWLLFPGMYLLAGAFTALGVSVEMSFLIASPTGVFGFIFWVTAFIVSTLWLVKAKNIAVSVGGVVLSVIPLAFLGFGFWVAVNGGV